MLAFTLPDHGAEWPGMGDAWSSHPSWELVDAASQAAGQDVSALLLGDRATRSTRSPNAHLATFVLSLVALDAAERLGLAPMAVSGYGLGEYTALVAAGALDFDDGVRLVIARGHRERARRRDDAVRDGDRRGLVDDDVEAACARAEGARRGSPATTRLGASSSPAHPRASPRRSRSPARSARRARSRSPRAAGSTRRCSPARASGCERRSPRSPSATRTRVVANVDARHHSDPPTGRASSPRSCARRCAGASPSRRLYAEGVRTFVEFGAGTPRSPTPISATLPAEGGPDPLDRLAAATSSCSSSA